MQLLSIQDIFQIKESAPHFKARAQKVLFLKNCAKQLELLPYNSEELEKIKTFLRQKAGEYNIPAPEQTTSAPVLHFEVSPCICQECTSTNAPVCNSILHPFEFLKALKPFMQYIDYPSLTNISALDEVQCSAVRDKMAAQCLDDIITW